MKYKLGNTPGADPDAFFAFTSKKIEWVWLYENHLDLFEKAQEYEKEGYTWMEEETLEELAKPERIQAIKREHFLRTKRLNKKRNGNSWKDEVLEAEGVGCASCFI